MRTPALKKISEETSTACEAREGSYGVMLQTAELQSALEKPRHLESTRDIVNLSMHVWPAACARHSVSAI